MYDFDEAVSTFRDPFAKIFNDVWHSENEHCELIIGCGSFVTDKKTSNNG